MDIEKALSEFYLLNSIDYDRITDRKNLEFDKKIEAFPQKTEHWLNSFDTEEQEIFLNLLSKYVYFTYPKFLKEIHNVISNASTKLGVEVYNILFVTVESKKGVKCGGDDIRSAIHKQFCGDIDKSQIIGSISKVDENIIKNYSAVVFIDDIVGTGFTSFKCISNFVERFHLSENPEIKLMIAPLQITRRGKDCIKQKCKKASITIEILDLNILKSAFTGDYIFPGSLVGQKKEAIKKYEEKFDEFDKTDKTDKKSFKFGFDNSQLLFSTYYDTPNNTLCSFWKITDTHKALFPRDGQKKIRPNINELKNTKKTNQEHAYDCSKIIHMEKKK